MKKVMIVIPTLETIHHKVVGNLLATVLRNKKYDLDTVVSAMSGVGEHRNVLAKYFLESDCDFLLMIDSDNPPPINVLDLVELNKEVIGLPTPINMSPHQGLTEVYWNIFKDGFPTKDEGKGLVEVENIGSGAMLIRRDVLEKIEHPFTTIRDLDDLRIQGTDIAFCKKCQRAGIKIWAHWDYKCSHFKTIDLSTLCYSNY